MAEDERISVDGARLREDDGLAVVKRIVPAELAVERRKPVRREIRIERQPRDGGLDQLDRHVPGIEPVQRLHLLPGDGLLRVNLRQETRQQCRRRPVKRNHHAAENDARGDPRGTPVADLSLQIGEDDGHPKGDGRPDKTQRHQPAITGLLGARGIGLALQLLDLGNKGAVGADIHVGFLRQLLELLARQRGELLAKLVTVTRKRLIDVLDQKNVPLACALTSAEAVNGMRVV